MPDGKSLTREQDAYRIPLLFDSWSQQTVFSLKEERGNMHISCVVDALEPVAKTRWIGRRFACRSLTCGLGTVLIAALVARAAMAQDGPLVLERDGRVISLEPYAANILRVTMSIDKSAATAAPGYGFVAKPSEGGWTHERDAEGNDVFRSSRMVVRVAPADLPKEKLPQRMPLDALNLGLRDRYFGGGGPPTSHADALQVTTSEGKMLLQMRTWTMAPERAEVAEADAGPKGHRVAAVFDSPSGEHYYGLGQQQQGWMDLRTHQIRCWHDYTAFGGENVCVPFMVSTFGYGLVWDNPSKTTVDLGVNKRNVWSSEVG